MNCNRFWRETFRINVIEVGYNAKLFFVLLKNYIGSDFATCPFNARHEMPKPELRYHLANCPDKAVIEPMLAYGRNDHYFPCVCSFQIMNWWMCFNRHLHAGSWIWWFKHSYSYMYNYHKIPWYLVNMVWMCLKYVMQRDEFYMHKLNEWENGSNYSLK